MPCLVKLVIAKNLGDDHHAVVHATRCSTRSDSWFRRFWARLRAAVIRDVPTNLDECEACREVSCTQERWLSCARRLAAEAERRGDGNDVLPSVTGRTDEMPGIFATDGQQEPSTENETAESGDQHKRISSSID